MSKIGAIGLALCAASLAGCSVATSRFDDGAMSGGAVVGSLGTAAVPVAAAPAPPPPMGAFLEGPVGSKLGEADRDKAYHAEVDALSAGDRKTWRGLKGNFGFVAMAGAETPDACRGFAHTVYIAGRPQTGKGTGCRQPDGTWRITG